MDLLKFTILLFLYFILFCAFSLYEAGFSGRYEGIICELSEFLKQMTSSRCLVLLVVKVFYSIGYHTILNPLSLAISVSKRCKKGVLDTSLVCVPFSIPEPELKLSGPFLWSLVFAYNIKLRSIHPSFIHFPTCKL